MKRDLMQILACPACKADLELAAAEEKEDEILSGKLTCTSCARSYPIEDGIPNLLVPETETNP